MKKGDKILERSGGTNENPVGRVVYFDEEGLFLFNNFTQMLRCVEGVTSIFIFYSLYNYYQTNKDIIRSMGNKTTGIQNLKIDKYIQKKDKYNEIFDFAMEYFAANDIQDIVKFEDIGFCIIFNVFVGLAIFGILFE